MKKFLLSALVIVSFAFYSLNQKVSGSAVTSPSVSGNAGNVTPTPMVNSGMGAGNGNKGMGMMGKYKNGTYTGDSADAFYGNVRVQATIQNGKITDVVFLDYPKDRGHSVEINNYAMPLLKNEAIQNQTASVDIVSGATATSQAFIQSLQSALTKAQ